MQICKTVTLRTKKLKNGMLSYYLDYYPGLRDNITMKIVRHEFIGIYIYPDPGPGKVFIGCTADGKKFLKKFRE